MAINLDGNGVNTTGLINSATAQASTSGTSIDFTGIPSGVKRITVMFNGVSTSGSNYPLIQIGAGSIDATSYAGGAQSVGTGLAYNTTGYTIYSASGANILYGSVVLTLLGSNLWVASGVLGFSGGGATFTAGVKTLSGTLDRVRITTVGGTDTFDAGSVNILYE